MERIPPWVLGLAAVVFLGLAVWSVMEENWAGVIAGVVLGGACLVGLFRRPATR